MKINVKLMVFGIDEEYNVFVLLNNDNDFYTKEINDDSPKSIKVVTDKMFFELLGFDAGFSKVSLSSVEIQDIFTVYYLTHIPIDTFNKEGYRWVKPNETYYTANRNNGHKLSLECYKAIFSALGQRKYEDYSCRNTK